MEPQLLTIDVATKTGVPKEPVIYSNDYFGILDTLAGDDVKISIVGTGLPDHKCLSNLSDFETIIDNEDEVYDTLGTSTSLSGLIGGDDTVKVRGLSPSGQLLCLKAFRSNGTTDYDTLTAAVLWSIIKEANIIVFPFLFDLEHQRFRSSIKKAYKSGIFILAPMVKDGYKYEEIICVGGKKRKKGFSLLDFKKDMTIAVPKEPIISLFGKNSYISVGPELASLGMATGLVSNLVGKHLDIKTKNVYDGVVEDLKQLV